MLGQRPAVAPLLPPPPPADLGPKYVVATTPRPLCRNAEAREGRRRRATLREGASCTVLGTDCPRQLAARAGCCPRGAGAAWQSRARLHRRAAIKNPSGSPVWDPAAGKKSRRHGVGRGRRQGGKPAEGPPVRRVPGERKPGSRPSDRWQGAGPCAAAAAAAAIRLFRPVWASGHATPRTPPPPATADADADWLGEGRYAAPLLLPRPAAVAAGWCCGAGEAVWSQLAG